MLPLVDDLFEGIPSGYNQKGTITSDFLWAIFPKNSPSSPPLMAVMVSRQFLGRIPLYSAPQHTPASSPELGNNLGKDAPHEFLAVTQRRGGSISFGKDLRSCFLHSSSRLGLGLLVNSNPLQEALFLKHDTRPLSWWKLTLQGTITFEMNHGRPCQ